MRLLASSSVRRPARRKRPVSTPDCGASLLYVKRFGDILSSGGLVRVASVGRCRRGSSGPPCARAADATGACCVSFAVLPWAIGSRKSLVFVWPGRKVNLAALRRQVLHPAQGRNGHLRGRTTHTPVRPSHPPGGRSLPHRGVRKLLRRGRVSRRGSAR